MDGKTVSNEEKYFEIFERLKNVGFRKEIQSTDDAFVNVMDAIVWLCLNCFISDDFDIVITSSLMTSSGNLQIGPKIQILEQVIKYFHKIDNNISIEPHEIISLNMESLDHLVNLMLARLETINVDHGRQLDLLARSYLDKQLNIFPTTEIVKRIGKSQIKAEMSLKEQAAAVLLEYGKEIESVDEEKIRKIRSKIERNIDLGEAEISELRKVAISQEKVEDIKSNMEMLDDIIVENLKSKYEKKLDGLKSKKAQFIKRREYLVKLETDSEENDHFAGDFSKLVELQQKAAKVENSLSRLHDEQEISDLNFKNISTELNQKEKALTKLEESRNKLKNDLDRIDTELAEKRFHLSKYSTNNQLYQFRERLTQLFILSAKLTDQIKEIYESENRCTVEASFLDAEIKLLNQTISIVCNNPSELHQDIISSLSMAKAKFQATIQKNDAHINVLLAQIGEMRAQNLEILELERTLSSLKN